MKSVYFLFACFLYLISCVGNKQESVELSIPEQNIDFAAKQLEILNQNVGDTTYNPRTIEDSGILHLIPSKDWTSGFYPGALWYMYEFTQDSTWLKEAIKYTMNVEQEKYNNKTHDMGFKINCSFGNGYRLTGQEEYRDVLIQSAKVLSTRFNESVGCIRSWDHHQHLWQYPVIIDNMMNLELLFLATELTGDSSFYHIAVSHADTTIKHHFRPDYGTYHVLDYDTITGKVLSKVTHQGYAAESTWSRGQAWALYGYTMCYRETGKERYLEQAVKIADFIINHPAMPEDCVPYWDFDAPQIPDEPRDVSAAAIMSSAFFDLSKLMNEANVEIPKDSLSNEYRTIAETILTNLSQNYRNEVGEHAGFLLDHSVGSKPHDSEVDVPIIYADYYFLEANKKYMESKP